MKIEVLTCMKKIDISPADFKKIKRIELDILAEFDRICSINGIDYSLAYGTLLGAIRHSGFIPWDDDIDVIMTRENYNKFLKTYKNEINKKFFFQDNVTDRYYFHVFGKMRMNGTIFKESFLAKYNINHGVYIDVFVADKIPNDNRLSKQQLRKCMFYRAVLNSKYLSLSERKGIKKIEAFCLRSFFFFFSKKFLLHKFNYWSQKYDYLDDYSYNCFAANKVLEKNIFSEYTHVLFENFYFMSFAKYDECLKQWYGDYLILPPEEERIPHHFITELNIADYE